jgi:uncharacterized membrane protein (UPF0182 family)
VSFGGRVGYDASLANALDQVFGAGAGATVTTPTQGGAQPSAPGTAAPSGAGSNPAAVQAAADISAALAQLKAAQQGGDFAAQGQALAALDSAVQRFQQAQSAPAPAPGG